jgi:hypothetical protein
MSSGRKKKAKRPAKPRDPFWRIRRMLGASKAKSRKAYDRASERKAAREAKARATETD